MKLLEDPGEAITLPKTGSLPAESHLFEPDTVNAVNAALAASRPLLIRGDPGVGKSQLARAAAHQLGRAFISYVVDARTESRDLLYDFDAVQRLADAQIYAKTESTENARDLLKEANYLRPGPFWWAFNWNDAKIKTGGVSDLVRECPDEWEMEHGCTVLIDEIDKGEADVPNGLLEVLGSRRFTPKGTSKAVEIQGAAPLVIITTNAERILPDAFLRRCFVMSLELPSQRTDLIKTLIQRAEGHFPDADKSVLGAAANLLANQRDATKTHPRPGQAEFLDLIRAVTQIKQTPEEQIAHLAEISVFAFEKRAGLGI